MSCYMLSIESRSAIADYIASVLNSGFDYHGYSAPETLKRALSDCVVCGYYEESKIFDRLTKLNAHACGERYHHLTGAEPGTYKRQRCITEYRQYEDGHEIIKPWHYQILKKIECFIYQCTEGDTPDTELYKGIEQLSRYLMAYIVHNTPEWNAALWG